MVERRRDPTVSSPNERPPDVRRRRTDLRARVNRDLPLEFDDVTLTSYAGLELFARYVRRVDFNRQVRQAWAGGPRWGDFGVVTMVRLVVGLVIVGGRRLRHLAYVADDPVFQRFAGGPRGADRADAESVADPLHDADRPPLAGPQCGGGGPPVARAGTAHLDDRCRWGGRLATHVPIRPAITARNGPKTSIRRATTCDPNRSGPAPNRTVFCGPESITTAAVFVTLRLELETRHD